MKRRLSYSYNPHSENGLKQLLFPTRRQLMLDFIVGSLLLIVINIRSGWQIVSNLLYSTNRAELVNLTEGKLDELNQYIAELMNGRFAQFLIWLFFGCLIYIAVWVMVVFLTNIRNDIVADQYIHPQSYDRSRFWVFAIGHKLVFFSVAIVFVAYIYAGLRIMVVLSSIFYQSIADFALVRSSLTVLGALVATAAVIQLFFILKPLLINSWNFIYRGF